MWPKLHSPIKKGRMDRGRKGGREEGIIAWNAASPFPRGSGHAPRTSVFCRQGSVVVDYKIIMEIPYTAEFTEAFQNATEEMKQQLEARAKIDSSNSSCNGKPWAGWQWDGTPAPPILSAHEREAQSPGDRVEEEGPCLSIT